MNLAARILVATDVVADCDLVRKLLRDEFSNVTGSTDPARAVEDFEKHQPQVLLLAFNSLEKAERYYLGLYRLGTAIHAMAHRTVILCSKDDLARVYALCRTEYFDDYVLFWPVPHDAPRLPMAVHHALRQSAEVSGDSGRPSAGEFAAQARRLVLAETTLAARAVGGSAGIESASRSLLAAQRDIGIALDGFSREWVQGSVVDVRDVEGFERGIQRLKDIDIAQSMTPAHAALQPLRDWSAAVDEGLLARGDSARRLQALADRVRPLVLVVDDDEYQHKLLRSLLRDESLDLAFADSGAAALLQLRTLQPDLILMDIGLPDIDGVETTRRVRAVARLAAVPILMITGHSDKEVVVRSIRAGASGFVVKPFDKAVLIARIRDHVDAIEAPVR